MPSQTTIAAMPTKTLRITLTTTGSFDLQSYNFIAQFDCRAAERTQQEPLYKKASPVRLRPPLRSSPNPYREVAR